MQKRNVLLRGKQILDYASIQPISIDGRGIEKYKLLFVFYFSRHFLCSYHCEISASSLWHDTERDCYSGKKERQRLIIIWLHNK